MLPSEAVVGKAELIRELVKRFSGMNPRVFGSALHRKDNDSSDLDILIDTAPGATLFDIGRMQVELESELGVRVDVVTARELPEHVRKEILREARAI